MRRLFFTCQHNHPGQVSQRAPLSRTRFVRLGPILTSPTDETDCTVSPTISISHLACMSRDLQGTLVKYLEFISMQEAC